MPVTELFDFDKKQNSLIIGTDEAGRGPAAGIDGHAQAPLLEPLFLRASDGDHDAADGWHHVLLF